MTYDKQRILRVQNQFLSFSAYLLSTNHPLHDYSLVYTVLSMVSTLAFRRKYANFSFISSLLDGFLDAPNTLSSIHHRVLNAV